MTMSAPARQIVSGHAKGGFDRSWVNRLMDRIAILPGPAWAVYLAALVVFLVLSHVFAWVEGDVPFGAPDVFRASIAIYVVGPLAAIRYLDSVARTALDRFRPALGLDDQLIQAFDRDLTTMPARPTLAYTLAGLVLGAAFVASGGLDPVGSFRHGPITFVFEVAAMLAAFALLPVFVYHTVRQLRLISRIHEQAKEFDLYRPDPLYAFSSLSAQTGGAILGMNYLAVATNPGAFANLTAAVSVAGTFVIAIGCFVVPLLGMHRRIEANKARLETDAGDVLRRAIDELDRRIRANDDEGASMMTRVLEGVVIKRDVIARMPTWPWRAGTLRAFASAVLLPVALWLVFRALGQYLG